MTFYRADFLADSPYEDDRIYEITLYTYKRAIESILLLTKDSIFANTVLFFGEVARKIQTNFVKKSEMREYSIKKYR